MGAAPKIKHPPDTAQVQVLAFQDGMVRLTMFRDGQELGRVTVPKVALLLMLNGLDEGEVGEE